MRSRYKESNQNYCLLSATYSPLTAVHLLPVFPALHFVERLKGGSTHPWVVLVLGASGKPEKYVVKPFRPSLQPTIAQTANEVLAAQLASAFDLVRPEPALIEFTPTFRSTLAPAERQQIQGAENNMYYGCRLLEGAYPWSLALSNATTAQYDSATIYAFDNLICNVDRRPAKPNLLVVAEEAYVIDHELACAIPGRTFARLREGVWEHNYQGHLFYQSLRSANHQFVDELFIEFADNLRRLNIDLLLRSLDQLLEHGVPVGEVPGFIQYLRYQKAHSQQFATLLRHTLQ